MSHGKTGGARAGKKNRKHGRNKRSCERYRLEGRREKSKRRKKEKEKRKRAKR